MLRNLKGRQIVIIAFSVPLFIFIGMQYVLQPAKPLPNGWPNGLVGMSRMGSVKMDSPTVLVELHQGNMNVFTSLMVGTLDDGADLIRFEPILYPYIIPWTQADHWYVANTLNLFAWNDTLGGWRLFSIFFNAKCGENLNGLGNSEFTFFKPKWKQGKLLYSWRALLVYPEIGGAIWAEGDFKHPFGSWKDIDLSHLTVSAEDALAIAVRSGGSEYLTREQTRCQEGTSVWLFPEKWYGWRVSIGGFLAYIDPATGEIIASFPLH